MYRLILCTVSYRAILETLLWNEITILDYNIYIKRLNLHQSLTYVFNMVVLRVIDIDNLVSLELVANPLQ